MARVPATEGRSSPTDGWRHGSESGSHVSSLPTQLTTLANQTLTSDMDEGSREQQRQYPGILRLGLSMFSKVTFERKDWLISTLMPVILRKLKILFGNLRHFRFSRCLDIFNC